MKYALYIAIIGILVGIILFAPRESEGQTNVSWADVSLAPGLTAVILRDNAPECDQLIVRTFFWQQVPGIEKPILRSVFDVIPALKNTAVAATGAPDPSKVQSVHVDAIRIADRMEWIPKPPEEPKK